MTSQTAQTPRLRPFAQVDVFSAEPYRGNPQTWYTKNPKFHRHWFDRITDLIDSYQPDLLYSDGGIPFGDVGRTMVAHLYNSSIARSGKLEAVYAHKSGPGEFLPKAAVQDVERGALEGINPLPWQTDTSNGDWFFNDRFQYKTADGRVCPSSSALPEL